jgi:hypothetical protein
MNYLERYQRGEYEQVWAELVALGSAVRREPHFSQAREVAAETMRRVRRNCETLVSRLRSVGYVFGVYADGSRGYSSDGPLVPPSAGSSSDLAELEEQVGPLPLSLRAFWEEVGSVDFVGRHRSWPAGRDPLVVYPPEGALAELEMMEEAEDDLFEAPLAPDDLHKDNISGGDAYAIGLPDPCADSRVLNERHALHLVPYLRLAILRWGGFPGLEGQKSSFEPLGALVSGLEPF